MSNKVIYITGNEKKFANAEHFLAKYKVNLQQQKLSLNEIQSDEGVAVAVRKARDAYAEIKRPLFVNDASWIIPSLGGFPGPYMKYIVNWLDLDSFMALLKSKKDRSVILRDTIVYIDESGEKVFTADTHGTILLEPAGSPKGPFVTQIISLRKDGKSIAEDDTVGFSEEEAQLWDEFGNWLKDRKG